MTTDSKAILLSPLFLIGLCLLLVNDFYLKAAFHNEITGKLSDFAGLFIFPVFFCALLPQFRQPIFAIVGAMFLFWKSSYSQPLIDLWNGFPLPAIGRTVDSTDLFALSSLPLSYYYLMRCLSRKVIASYRLAKASVVVLSVFAFTATHAVDDRSVWVDRSYPLALTRTGLEDRLRHLETVREVKVEKMTDAWPKDKYPKLAMSPTGYYLSFKIRNDYCESKEIGFFVSFEDKDDTVLIDGPLNFQYWCPNEPTKKDEVALTGILEDKVLNYLGTSPEK
jgi:hypothetical protein